MFQLVIRTLSARVCRVTFVVPGDMVTGVDMSRHVVYVAVCGVWLCPGALLYVFPKQEEM